MNLNKLYNRVSDSDILNLNGKRYKKQSNGNYLEVSEQGLTKKEHELKAREHGRKMSKSQLIESKVESKDEKFHFNKEQEHLDLGNSLSGKEFTSEELGFSNTK